METLDDFRIADLYFERNELAIFYTSEKYGSRLRRLSHNIVRDMQIAEECENDTYIKAWNSMPLHSPKEYLYVFLARITRHLSLNCCRNRGRLKRDAFVCELSAELEQCIPAPDDFQCRIDDSEFAEALNTFLTSLNAEKRQMFLRRYFYMDSIEDISKRFECSDSKVKTTLFRCRGKLREFLEKEGYTL